MISLLQRKGLKVFHPVLKRVAKFYLRKPRYYAFNNIKVRVIPGVFHPGLFFSTKVLLGYIEEQNLTKMSVLELGAGSGLISIFCANKGAFVTASDINVAALAELKVNAKRNDADIQIKESDLFDQLNIEDFDLIIINPPYYPNNPRSVEEHAWYCGEEFEYFKKLFFQLKAFNAEKTQVLMILSEDCHIEKIKSIAKQESLIMNIVHRKKVGGEENLIYRIMNDSA
ncbi:methyltransferase [Ekhidna sp.]